MEKPTLPPPRKPAPSVAPPQAQSPTKAFALTRAIPKWEPPRIVLNAVEGWGKTTAIAHAEDVAILMAAGETGYDTLLGVGSVPAVTTAHVDSWSGLLALLDAWPSGHKTIALDALGGFERLCHEHVCRTQFGGDWGERGFASYQKGFDVSIGEWLGLLARLDRIRAQTGAAVIITSHCRIKTFKNPLGPDFDRWCADCHDKTWAVTAKWADAVLFGNFFTVVQGGTAGERPKKGKGIGGTERILYTERRDAWDAKNRYGRQGKNWKDH